MRAPYCFEHDESTFRLPRGLLDSVTALMAAAGITIDAVWAIPASEPIDLEFQLIPAVPLPTARHDLVARLRLPVEGPGQQVKRDVLPLRFGESQRSCGGYRSSVRLLVVSAPSSAPSSASRVSIDGRLEANS